MQTQSLGEIRDQATTLHGMLQGLELLLNEVVDASPLHNGIHSIAQQARVSAGSLTEALDNAERSK